MNTLKILAGASAYRQIHKNGLRPEDISAVFGASGAAKWLTIYGLDSAVFSQWLPKSSQSVDLFGTSVGAFKLAAAARLNSADALRKLAHAYINQDYVNKNLATQIVIETDKVIRSFLNEDAITEILENQRFNYHCGTVLCSGWLGSESLPKQKAAMVKAFFQSLAGRRFHRNIFDRCIFHSGIPQNTQVMNHYAGADQFRTYRVPLSPVNFRLALQASGSIPVLMPGVSNIPGAEPGMHRDGGLLDYHAVPSNITQKQQGLVLYPHFYSQLKEGWFDKFWPWRKASAEQLDNTVLVAPSEDFVASLPGRRIPERQDFQRFAKNDGERIRRWNQVMERSIELGEEFIQLADSGDIAARVELIS